MPFHSLIFRTQGRCTQRPPQPRAIPVERAVAQAEEIVAEADAAADVVADAVDVEAERCRM